MLQLLVQIVLSTIPVVNVSGTSSIGDELLRVARSYSDGGGYDHTWKGTGTPAEVRYHGELVLARGEVDGVPGTYCSGFTFAVAMKALTDANLIPSSVSVAQVRSFQKDWYGRSDDSREKQCVYALKKLGLGEEVRMEDARPGDLVQFWRSTTSGKESGHSAVFLEWVIKDGDIVGIRYRSSQQSSKGIGDREESLGVEGGSVDRARIYLVRVKDR